MAKDNIILARTFDFALIIIELCKEMNGQREYVLSNQLMRSGTSIGANVEESIAGTTIKDFAHKNVCSVKRDQGDTLLAKIDSGEQNSR